MSWRLMSDISVRTSRYCFSSFPPNWNWRKWRYQHKSDALAKAASSLKILQVLGFVTIGRIES